MTDEEFAAQLKKYLQQALAWLALLTMAMLALTTLRLVARQD
ncbi:MAG: hypothetical protein WDZ94_02450 [Patescibacteria group bacterium]